MDFLAFNLALWPIVAKVQRESDTRTVVTMTDGAIYVLALSPETGV